MPSTIKDIAKKLNLSVSTVSYALNGGPKPVSSAVREKVFEAVKELDYRPNHQARSLITRQNRSVGLYIEDLVSHSFSSSFVQAAMSGCINAASKLQQDILLMTSQNSNQRHILECLQDSRVDGAVLVTPRPEIEDAVASTSKRFPYAVLSGSWLDSDVSFSADNSLGTRLALEHLYELGHRKIGHIRGLAQQGDSVARESAYRSFMLEAGLEVRESWVRTGNWQFHDGRIACLEILNDSVRPTAIFCANDMSAFGAISAANELDVSVPDQLSIVGFDDTEAAATYTPALTSIRQPVEEMAEFAFEAVVLAATQQRPVTGKVFETSLVIRSSTAHCLEG